jgi:hypothetical protein
VTGEHNRVHSPSNDDALTLGDTNAPAMTTVGSAQCSAVNRFPVPGRREHGEPVYAGMRPLFVMPEEQLQTVSCRVSRPIPGAYGQRMGAKLGTADRAWEEPVHLEPVIFSVVHSRRRNRG